MWRLRIISRYRFLTGPLLALLLLHLADPGGKLAACFGGNGRCPFDFMHYQRQGNETERSCPGKEKPLVLLPAMPTHVAEDEARLFIPPREPLFPGPILYPPLWSRADACSSQLPDGWRPVCRPRAPPPGN